MNLCFVRGKIISDVEFQFMIESKSNSICYFKLQLENKSEILVKGYNELADFCYRNLAKEDIVLLQGRLTCKMEMILEEINF